MSARTTAASSPSTGITTTVARRRGHLRARRQRRGQVDADQDPRRGAPARPGARCCWTASPCSFGAPRARRWTPGIATVYQDLAMIPLMAIWRNFFLGAEPTRGWGPFRRFDAGKRHGRSTRGELADMGIDIRDPDQPVGTLSGGERQSRGDRAGGPLRRAGADPRRADRRRWASSRPASCSAMSSQARDRGRRRRPDHAQPAPRLPGGRPVLAAQPRQAAWATSRRPSITLPELTRLMAGGAELDQLAHELERGEKGDVADIGKELLRVSKTL